MDGYPQGGSIFQLVYCISIVRSAGCFFFSLLSIMVLFVSATSWFGCVTSLSLYFFPYLAISSLTVGIFKSLRKSSFLTYHGALTIVLKIFAIDKIIEFNDANDAVKKFTNAQLYRYVLRTSATLITNTFFHELHQIRDRLVLNRTKV